jgi:hypothetical protein
MFRSKLRNEAMVAYLKVRYYLDQGNGSMASAWRIKARLLRDMALLREGVIKL